MRAPGQKAAGTFSVESTRAIRASAPEVYGPAIRVVSEWLGREPSGTSPGAKAPNARWTLDARERLLLTVTTVREGSVTLGLTHSGIVDGEAAPAAKAALKELLAGFELSA